jgi:deoxyribonuclease-4
MTTPAKDLLIGAHTSAQGGVQNALIEGKKIGATTVQLFTANQRQWKSKTYTQEELDLWFKTLEETGLKKIMSHDSYLINLGCPNEETLLKSLAAFQGEIERCKALKISFLNFHPGSALTEDPQACLDQICKSLLEMEPLMENSPTRLLLESTAGQGTTVGWKFEHLAYIIKKVEKKIPIGVCIDTCHSFAAGYDMRDEKSFDATLKEFDAVVGLKNLYAFHLNDSKKGLGCRVDRHEPLGEGQIGIECFKLLMQDPRTREIPKYLETPLGPELWVKEIAMLRKFAQH